jgi:3-hydroxyacyl-[acyl-carrier-protein] dehydratase
MPRTTTTKHTKASTRATPRRQTGARLNARAKPTRNTTVALRLVAALQELGYTKSDLARLLAGPDATQTRIEGQRRLVQRWAVGTQPGLENASKLSDLLGKPADYFLPPGAERSADDDAVAYGRQMARRLRRSSAITGPLSKKQIAALFVHFNEDHVLVDQVDAVVPGARVIAKRFKADPKWPPKSFYYTADMIPGFVLAEALAQTAAIALLAQDENRHKIVLCAAFINMRFKRVVHADDEVRLDATITKTRGDVAHADVEASVGGQVAVKGRLVLSIT